MKHIKVLVRATDNPNYVEMVVSARTHSGMEFGGNAERMIESVFLHNRTKLRARETKPHFSEYGGYLEVTLGADVLPTTIEIPRQYWFEVKEAIQAYNEWGREQ
jgi:hypothetical protein